MIEEWTDISKYQARRIDPNTGNWDPANWDTSAIDFDKLVAEAEGVIIRIGDGLNLDPCFIRYRDALTTRRALWAIYHLHRTSFAAGLQEAFIKMHQPDLPPAGVWGDLEFNGGLVGESYFNNANRYLLNLDRLYDFPAGIYSGAWFLDPILTRAQQARWAPRAGWWASYPNLNVPSGWEAAERPHVLHQYTDRRVWPGLPKPADASWRNPDVSLSELIVGGGSMPDTRMHNGAQYAIHAEQTSSAVPIMQKFQDAGVQVTAIIAVENPGLCVDAKQINPNTLTIARWLHPNNKWERGHDVFNWPQAERQACVESSIQLIFDRTNDTEYQACDYFAPVFNEPDPPEANGDGYKALAEVMIMLCHEATRRSPELVARGLHPILLALGAFNRGTPEWVEMRAMRDTGLFDLMKERGDLLITHEGVGLDEPANHMHGDLIPGAPFVPPYAGALAGRINYLYSLGVEIPFVVTEWYDGMWRTTDPAVRFEAMKWYDRLMRHNKWFRGFCPFELTDVQDGAWWLWDFTPTFKSDAMLADMVAERNKPNPVPEEDDMNETTRLQLIADLDGAQTKILSARATLMELAPEARHTMGDKTNQQVINLFDLTLGGFDELTRAIPGWATSMALNQTTRALRYTGPAIEDMAALTPAERARLIAALGG